MSTWEPPWPHIHIRTHHDLIQYYYAKYDRDIQSGEFEPFVYPYGSFAALVVILYLLVPHERYPWLRKARFLVFAWLTAFSAYTIRYTRARTVAPAFGIGLVSSWGVMWVMTILLLNDAQTDFQRIERMEGVFQKRPSAAIMNGTPRIEGADEQRAAEVPQRLGPSERHGEFAWQPYPLRPFAERLDWVLDLFCNFRGVGWNWRTSSIPPPPEWVQVQLRRNSPGFRSHSDRVHPGQPYTYPTRKELLIGNVKTFLMGYLVLDGLKTVVNHDPYFWGLMDRHPPAYFPDFIASSPVLLKMYRLAISQFAVQWALRTIFSLAPLFFSGLLGPSVIGARAEPWMYPDTWGSYSMVFERGLAGWWASWWHQTFRFAFEQPGKKLVRWARLNRSPALAKLTQLIVAFGLSGILHACGSYTSVGPTSPMKEPLVFFLLQAVGIFSEAVLKQAWHRATGGRVLPKWATNAFTFLYVHVWFYYTAPLLCDDFAKGGVWLFEPVPISLFRSLGLGVEGDSWWCWSGQPVRWHRGDRWWKSGVAF